MLNVAIPCAFTSDRHIEHLHQRISKELDYSHEESLAILELISNLLNVGRIAIFVLNGCV